MAAGPEGWQVDAWRGPSGARPVKEFIDGLSKAARVALGDGLHELRITHPEGPFWIIYCYQLRRLEGPTWTWRRRASRRVE